MREIFLQIVYGRSQTAFSEGGLPVGAPSTTSARAFALRSAPCSAPRPRALVTSSSLRLRHPHGSQRQERDYRVRVPEPRQVHRRVKAGKTPEEAIAGAMGHYGQWENAAKYIDPRTDEETHSVASVFPVQE